MRDALLLVAAEQGFLFLPVKRRGGRADSTGELAGRDLGVVALAFEAEAADERAEPRRGVPHATLATQAFRVQNLPRRSGAQRDSPEAAEVGVHLGRRHRSGGDVLRRARVVFDCDRDPGVRANGGVDPDL
jgi:hypothetical protein